MLKRKAFVRVLAAMAAAVMILIQTAAPASAQTSVKVTYDAASESVVVELLTERPEKAASVTIEKDGKFWVIDEFKRTDKENFTVTCKLPTDCPSGSYTVEVTIGGETASGEIAHINKTMAGKAIELINGADETTFASVIQKTYSELAIDMAVFNKYSELLTELYYKYKPEGDLSIAQFSEHYGMCLVLCELTSKSGTEAESYLLENASVIGFDKELYGEKSNAEKNEIIGRFVKGEYEEKTLSEQFAVWFCLAEINALTDGGVSTYEEALFKTYADVLELDEEIYEESPDKDEVIRLMMEKTYDSIDEIKDSFTEAIETVEEEEEESDKSSGGGSSGGSSGGRSGGSVGGISWAPVTEEKTQAEEAQKQEAFSDVAENHWCSKQIAFFREKGIISGTGNNEFYPEKEVTRAEFSKMLVSALFADYAAEAKASFNDVSESSWCYEYINKAYSLGIVKGSDSGSFLPDEKITRQDMAVMLYRAQGVLGTQKQGGGIGFTDENDMADYAKEAITSLSGSGILNGMEDGSFNPKGMLKRAQAVKALYEAMNAETN